MDTYPIIYDLGFGCGLSHRIYAGGLCGGVLAQAGGANAAAGGAHAPRNEGRAGTRTPMPGKRRAGNDRVLAVEKVQGTPMPGKRRAGNVATPLPRGYPAGAPAQETLVQCGTGEDEAAAIQRGFWPQ